MKRTTVRLPDDVASLLRREAGRRGTTVSAITREAIESYLGVGIPRQLYGTGAGSSGRADISRRIEEILLKEAHQVGP
jgi:predicted transcriptional regulator